MASGPGKPLGLPQPLAFDRRFFVLALRRRLGLFQQPEQMFVGVFVAGDDVAAVQHLGSALKITVATHLNF